TDSPRGLAGRGLSRRARGDLFGVEWQAAEQRELVDGTPQHQRGDAMLAFLLRPRRLVEAVRLGEVALLESPGELGRDHPAQDIRGKRRPAHALAAAGRSV